jgi:CheY-like chemotaxis protein
MVSRIVVADDDPSALEGLRSLLAAWGYEVETAHDGRAALEQEFVLSGSPDSGRSFKDIVRQQWNFSSPGAIREVEDYHVELSGVTQFDLTIAPDQRGGDAWASLARWRLA